MIMESLGLVVFAHLLLWHSLSKDMVYDGAISIDIGGSPREALTPARSVEMALLPMIRGAKQQTRARRSRHGWRKYRKDSQQGEECDQEVRRSEFRAQEDLIHKAIATFPR